MNIIKKLKKLSVGRVYKLSATDGEIVASAYFANREDAEEKKNSMELSHGIDRVFHGTPKSIKFSIEAIELVKDRIQEHNIHRHLQN